MSFLKKTFYRAVSAVPVAALKRTKAVNLLLPYHHLVANEPVNHVRYIFPYKNEQEFIRDLDYLLAHFHPVNPDDLIRAMRSGDPIKPGGFLLSFDDGFRQVYDVVMPLLLRKGVPAVFFLNPAFLDNRMLFYRNKISLILHALALRKPSPAIGNEIKKILSAPDDDESMISQKILAINSRNSRLADQLGNCLELSFDDYLSQQRPYLTNNQVAQLVEKGFHVGGHSLDHPNYKYIGLDEQIYQTMESCAIVRKRNGLDYSLFSFPHEDAPLSQAFFDELARSPGERIDALFGTQNQLLENNNRVLHRFNAERPEYPFEGLVKGVLLYNLQKKIRNRQLVQRPQTSHFQGNRLNEF